MTIFASLLAAAAVAVAPAQAAPATDLGGVWNGSLTFKGQSIRILLRVDAAGAAVLDSPDQGATGIPVTGPTSEGSVLRFAIPSLRAQFEGQRSTDGATLTGAFSQGGANLPLILTRTATTAVLAPRPQTPVPPFPYRSEDVAFDNASAPGVRLAGTLTLPEGAGPFPAAILITGSGPQDRDETVFGHKPFAIWSDVLTRRGIAVLRYDDRGTAASTGDFAAATSADFASDAEAAFAWLAARPEIDSRRIGLMGHSEGGLIAPMVVQEGVPVAWVVMLAGPAVSGGDILIEQQRLLATVSGLSPDEVETTNRQQREIIGILVRNASSAATARSEVQAYLVEHGTAPEQAARLAGPISSAWYRWLVTYDPGAALARLDVPLLAVYGARDLQVSAEQNVPVLARLKPDARIVVLPDLNHLMQRAETGLVAEYETIETTIDPVALSSVADWVAAQALSPNP